VMGGGRELSEVDRRLGLVTSDGHVGESASSGESGGISGTTHNGLCLEEP
jgi:hypothetical protein